MGDICYGEFLDSLREVMIADPEVDLTDEQADCLVPELLNLLLDNVELFYAFGVADGDPSTDDEPDLSIELAIKMLRIYEECGVGLDAFG